MLRIIGLRDAADSVCDEAGDETDEQLTEQCLRYEWSIDRIQQITDAHADRAGDATERSADDERTEYHDGISEVDGCHIRTDRNLDLQEGEDCIGKRCEQSGKRKLIGFRVIHNVASSGVFRHLPVLPCIIGQSWHYRNYQIIFILYDQMAGRDHICYRRKRCHSRGCMLLDQL